VSSSFVPLFKLYSALCFVLPFMDPLRKDLKQKKKKFTSRIVFPALCVGLYKNRNLIKLNKQISLTVS
jgi:hypothetical protein